MKDITLNVQYSVTLSPIEVRWLSRHAQLQGIAGQTLGEVLANLFQAQGTERLLFSHETRQALEGEWGQ